MSKGTRTVLLVCLVLAALGASSCIHVPGARGTFEKTLSVTGPVNLEVDNGSGNVVVSAGLAEQVHIRGEFRVHVLPWEDAERIAEEFRKSPPIEQQGNLIRIGKDGIRPRNITVDYTIMVPAATELRVDAGSGNIEVSGLAAHALLDAGSGNVVGRNLGADVEVDTRSGNIELEQVAGEAQVDAGSGNIRLKRVGGAIRADTGSGNMRIEEPGSRVQAESGSGNLRIFGAAADLRASAGSGNLTVEGTPAPLAYWELRTRSGNLQVDVPENASFVFHARWTSGDIETLAPIEVTERSKRELRGRVGKGEARVSVETSSGRIVLR